jgi:hypothetical protein
MQAGALSRYSAANVAVDRGASISIGGANASASVVTVSYPFDFIVLNPVARLVAGKSKVGGSQISMTAQASMRNESQF